MVTFTTKPKQSKPKQTKPNKLTVTLFYPYLKNKEIRDRDDRYGQVYLCSKGPIP